MPIVFGTEILSATYDASTDKLTVTGKAFGLNEYPVSDIEVSLTGAGAWSSVDTIDSWSDDEVIGSFSSALSGGTYDVRVTSSDGEVSPVSTGAFTISSSEFKDSLKDVGASYISIGANV